MTHLRSAIGYRFFTLALWASTTTCTSTETAAVTQCKQYRAAYCDYIARCSAGSTPTSQLKDQCVQTFTLSLDCNQVTATPTGTQDCVAALPSTTCGSSLPASCASQHMPVPPPAVCRLDASTSATDQASMLAQCTAAQLSATVVDVRTTPDLDVLFVIDNSPSMSPKQGALAQNIPLFIKQLDALKTNYHIGITTSDVGTQVAAGVPWGGLIGSCDTFFGDDGILQATACVNRTSVSASAKNVCSALCPDPKFVPNDGKLFISKTDGVSNVPVAMALDPMTGKLIDTGPQNAFRCMALVGDSGCGVEGTMEGAKRALDGHRVENAGFFRSGSTLAVVFVTDEDDCSVQPARRNENNPATIDCDPTQPDSASCYGLDFRCFARSVQCKESMLTPGVKTECIERPDNYLTSVDSYVKFFSALRPMSKLLVSGIWTLPAASGGGNVELAKFGGTTSAYLNRAVGTKASCSYAADASIYGQAQLRLSKFASQIPGSVQTSICDINNYGAALTQIASSVATKLTASCLAKQPRLGALGQPDCLVGDVDASSPASTPPTPFSTCSSKCCDAFASASTPTPQDASVIAACTAETADACYCALPSRNASICAGGAVTGVWRKGGVQPPAGKVVSFRCINQ